MEREPIDRMRARLEALLKANAAPRCGARSKRTGKPCAPMLKKVEVISIWIPAGVRDPIDGARHSLIGLHQYYAHNCTHDVHGAGGEAQLDACRIEYEIQPKERDPEAASCRQFCHLTAHTDFLSYAGRE